MSTRPGNLSLFGRPENFDYNIAPRTPHSRSGRAEEGFTEADLDDSDAGSFATYRQQQTEPLLASSASSSFPTGYRSRGDDRDAGAKPASTSPWVKHLATGKNVLAKTPLLVGIVLAGLLLSLVVLSFKRPGLLDQVVGYTDKAHEDVADNIPRPPEPSYVDTYPPPGHMISYENYSQFPLTGQQFRDECSKMMAGKFMHHGTYWTPPAHGVMDVPHHDDVTDYHLPEGERTKVCTKTITYQLDGTVGLVADLALMAQAAALARERNRTFLVDDTYWNRGKWIDHFQDVRARQPGPEPGCRAPPPEELVACPRFARHWVINSRTAVFHFTHPFNEEYEDPYKQELNRLRPIFDNALQSFRQTIRPNAQNAALIRTVRSEMASILSIPVLHVAPVSAEERLQAHNPDPYIAVHIRRGDRKASTFPNRGHYVPLENYVQAAYGAWSRLYHEDISDAEQTFPVPPVTYVASDSHHIAHDFISAFPPTTAVFSLESSTNPSLRALAPQREYVQSDFYRLEEAERIRLTRGMVVDLAMISGLWAWEGEVVPAATICTLSSNACKVAALGLGWNRAFGFEDNETNPRGDINDERKRWIELDNRGIVSPVWTAFEVAP